MTRLRQYFPLIRTRQEILTEISENVRLRKIYETWNNEQQETFLDYCTGNRGVKVLYDSFFKEIIDPETVPERAEEFLSLILHQRVRILRILPLESPRLGDEHSLVIMDIVIELEDRSIANLEVQKLGYRFPGQRSACYSADLLMRQYKRVRGENGKISTIKTSNRYTRSSCMKKAPPTFISIPTVIYTAFPRGRIRVLK